MLSEAVALPFVSCVLAAAVCASVSYVRAEEALGPCIDPRVTVQGELEAQWIAAVKRLCAQLARIRNIDPSASVRIVAAGPDVIVEAALGDGRSAMRRVRSPDDLMLAIEALTLLPPPEPEQEALPPSGRVREQRLGVELGGGLTARSEFTPTYLATGIEVYAGVRIDQSLLALAVRWDVLEVLAHQEPREFEMSTVGIGFLYARGLRLGSSTQLDLGANALILAQSQSARPEREELEDVELDVRLGGISRLIFGRQPIRFSVGLSADFSPARLRQSNRVFPGFPLLPVMSAGLFVGTIWGET